ncbi:sugar phosphate isomerase/epimerase [Xylanibacillus composti]|uniref:Xylose isomerase n=1 Tax=Xylanibacillus composti TaxID=1572762 RepID=A0A8J4H2A3_9BACL|nr:sugar phosphate isomerase/epimerase family protein [Xylanibacillus composti]MDT9726232.1 sugar phosphate isomerase/epimerase [Xylanibacillus composti]GIQ68082.1 xylose isomerase [Xylanibacillus composti]
MRLAGPVFVEQQTPDSWIQYLKQEGYRAAVSPVRHDADDATIQAYREAAEAHDILIAEVGAWSNPISPDETTRIQAIDFCKRQLELAEKLGARCCVNIAGSRGAKWDGPHPDNFSEATFELIVKTTQDIIDSVQPQHTYYTLETMPWIIPDSADTYQKLIQAIDRKAFAVHFDPVNMISSPRIYAANGEMMKDFFAKLGPSIKNAHAKDIRLASKLTVHLDEVLPGTGELDYEVFLTEMNKLDPDTPLIVEHLSSEEEYRQAAGFIRQKASSLGISL